MYLQAAQGAIIGAFLGVVSVLMTINSYKSEIDEEKIYLLTEQHLLKTQLLEFKNAQTQYFSELRDKEQDITNKAEKLVSSFAHNQQQVMETISALEQHLKEERKFQVYYDSLLEATSTPDAQVAMTQIQNSTPSLEDKNQLLKLMFQNDNTYISKRASEKFLKVMVDEDIDFIIKRYIENMMRPSGFNPMTFIRDLSSRINKDNIFIFEKAIIKYTSEKNNDEDLYTSNLIELLYEEHLEIPETLNSLELLYSHFEKNGMEQSKSKVTNYIMMIKFKPKGDTEAKD
ncbi:hypothetical protein ACWO0W_004499 [Vibrio parahaemolyticus]